jgi:D-lactate dehydrogenase (cytochrome)
MTFLLNLNDPEEIERAEAVNARMVAHALEVGGTCTGEHGIGSGKIDFLEREHGDAVQVMRAIKRALDPGDILNPGMVLRPVAAAP